MVRDVLHSDVEFGRRLVEENQADAQIIEALCRRGIDRSKAARLVEDLRQKRRPEVEAAAAPELVAAAHLPAGIEADTRKRRGPSIAIPWWFLLLVAIFAGAVAYFFLQDGNVIEHGPSDADRHEVPVDHTKDWQKKNFNP